MGFSRLLIANRGEIAVRIQRAARELGMTTIQAHSVADADSLAVKMADKAINIGPPHAAKSYLNISAILAAAAATGAEAIHPGYGFLSENAAFADAVEAAGLVFVGPKGETIRIMGDKAAARARAKEAGVPVVPGSEGRVADLATARAVAAEIGYPVMIKASAGGGGRGIRVVENDEGFESAFDQASAEAKAAFGDGGLYLEKFIARARHIEVQVLGDGRDAIHCFERECSLQRRRQKVWEEAPSLALSPRAREALCASAVALARAVELSRRRHARISLRRGDRPLLFHRDEHPHPGRASRDRDGDGDRSRARDVAHRRRGAAAPTARSDVRLMGHAIEVRINAEDPADKFRPSPGAVTDYRAPGGPGTRFDTLLYQGYQISPFYDSLLGKLIVWDETRDGALRRMRRALDELIVEGVATTARLHQDLAEDETVRKGDFHTRWLEDWLSSRESRAAPMKEASRR